MNHECYKEQSSLHLVWIPENIGNTLHENDVPQQKSEQS